MADDKLRATPAARKLADDLGINLYDVSGSGANGRALRSPEDRKSVVTP